mmetsp:Transcript_24552/g.40693  ORF Transcript_24552/g.40693 Transcript_24552/m.40693 type:complete len:360 (-) Transcript_24552:36-1115(-)|eukprot:CAMPEP_0119314970 /NCGR_PEP_ID=MMETSP1333-20130426/34131_1 /TAXON_ID=418940 /ORGANISM="Scyphosphaera apsteinii, Strain RCC1455" /LENGTH=359 /DNA_ID=CAMNT_0007320179 /DNA_START=143 /DNA_END=1222 /DNA_ORIENTATION=-
MKGVNDGTDNAQGGQDQYEVSRSALGSNGERAGALTSSGLPVDKTIGFVLAIVSLTVVLCLHFEHHKRLRRRTTSSGQRGIYVIICRLAPAVAMAHCIAVVMPPLSEFMLVVSEVYISVAMYAFLELQLMLLWQKKHDEENGGGGGRSEVSLAFVVDPHDYLTEIEDFLQGKAHREVWAPPPLHIILRWLPFLQRLPCGKQTVPSYKLLKFTRHALIAYIFGLPFKTFFDIVVKDEFAGVEKYIFIPFVAVEFVLANVALYALLITYNLTKESLKDFNVLWKFVAIKAIVAVGFWQGLFFASLSAGLKGSAAADFGEAVVFWQAVVRTVEAIPLCLLLHFAFPHEELPMTSCTSASMLL